MSNEIQKFDTNDFVSKVKEKVKNVFADLIPEENWEELIKNEIKAFFEDSVQLKIENESRYWLGGKKYFTLEEQNVSVFRTLVWDICIKKTEESLKNELVEKYFKECWNPEKGQFSEEFKKIFEDSIPAAVDNYFRCIANRSSNELASQIENAIRNHSYQHSI